MIFMLWLGDGQTTMPVHRSGRAPGAEQLGRSVRQVGAPMGPKVCQNDPTLSVGLKNDPVALLEFWRLKCLAENTCVDKASCRGKYGSVQELSTGMC